jgi:hypothetical protein
VLGAKAKGNSGGRFFKSRTNGFLLTVIKPFTGARYFLKIIGLIPSAGHEQPMDQDKMNYYYYNPPQSTQQAITVTEQHYL